MKTYKFKALMVTGSYFPEVTGGAEQCRLLVESLKKMVGFFLLTTTRDTTLPQQSKVDGVDLLRIPIQQGSIIDYFNAIFKIISFYLYRMKDFQIIHLHGFSRKSILLVILSKLFQKKIIIKMTSVGHDDPFAMKKRGFFLNKFFAHANAYVGVAPQFERIYLETRLPAGRFRLIPNGIDINRFSPSTTKEKIKIRKLLGLPDKMKLILFVGHFSREKSPDILREAWKLHVAEKFPDTGIIFIGSTNPNHYEVDADLVKDIHKSTESCFNKRIFFIEKTYEIEKYFQAVDMFVLPSLREGLPNSLLEAMACGLPVITSRLEGVTDWIVEDGKNGSLFESVIRDDLGKALISVLKDEMLAHSLGLKARETVLERFSMGKVAEEYLELYRGLIPLA